MGTSSGSLPRTESKYSSAHSGHHFVLGTENAQSVTDNARLVVGNSRNVIETTLHEFTKVDNSGDIFVVYLPVVNDSKEIDSVIASTIDDVEFGTVILTSIRSVDEFKLERNLVKTKRSRNTISQRLDPRRRVDEEGEGENNENAQNQNVKGVYFVNFTPNILSGVLFFFFFVAVVQIGLGSMNMIASDNDFYAKKYPAIGKEV